MFSLKPLTIPSALILSFFTLLSSSALACPPYEEQEWYVKAGADPSIATGTEDKPFASLIAAQNASCVGDRINIIPVDSSIPALDGGIILKDHQKLHGLGPKVTDGDNSISPRITNSIGDAITLANNNMVQNIFITEPKGAGITAIDVNSGTLKDLLIVRSSTNTITPGFPAQLCNIILDPTGTAVNNDASNLMACGGIIRPGLNSTRPVKGAINLFNEDVNGTFKIQDIITRDRPVGPPPTGRVWQSGLFMSVAGHATLVVNVDNFTSERSTRGVFGLALDHGTLMLNGNNITVTAPINDGIGLFTGFLCSGLAPNTDLGGITCAQAAGSPIPISHANLIANINHYNFTGLERPGSGNNNNSGGLEFGPNDQGTSRIEIHMQNSVITQAPAFGIDLEAPLGYFSADSIVDLGCIKDCNKKIYTSNGNNIIFNNGINGLSIAGIPPLTVDQVTNSIDLVLNGGNNNLNNNIIVAQGNYWSGIAMSPDNCVKVDYNGVLVQPIPVNSNCALFPSFFNTTSTYFDARYPLLEID